MSIDLSKLCADFLRQNNSKTPTEKLKASHAREIVAAVFGYKSHAALLAEMEFPLCRFKEVAYFAPDIALIQARVEALQGLPQFLMPAGELAKGIVEYLQKEELINGEIWLYETIESYIREELLIKYDSSIMDQLSGIMTETNAGNWGFPDYEEGEIVDHGQSIEVIIPGKYKGEQRNNEPFCGDTIDMIVRVQLHRVAGKTGFSDFKISADGEVNNDWADPEMKYSVPNIRPKDQFIQMTGGFRFGESREQFQNRQAEIHAIRNRIAEGKHSAKDLIRLARLLGIDDDDEL